jgi:predicted MFS family arabinose efflux permease
VSASPAAGVRARRATPLSPFRVRSFRFQWPADLLASWSFEMENLILGWFVLVKTESVLLLTVFGALQFLGTLLSPMFGVAGDRLGRRAMLCAMRAFYGALAAILMTLALAGVLQPAHIFPIAFLSGLVRPSDLVMRNALIGDTMPGPSLMGALGLSRMTMDSARIFGALAGASLFAAFGIGFAYTGVAACYLLSFLLTLGVSRVHPQGEAEPASGAPPTTLIGARWRELRDGLSYVWHTPSVLCLIWLAFLVSLTAFPMSHSLLPYVAREIYATDATGLGHLVAAFATGALLGSTIMTVARAQSSRFMVICIALWYALIAVFARMTGAPYGMTVLFVMGMCHSLGMVTMSGVLLRVVSERFRARVMGIRMLAVYGLPIGLLISGPLVERFGYPATASLYVAIGLAFTGVIAWRWRAVMWS